MLSERSLRIVAALLVLAAPAAGQSGATVERILAVVDGRPLLLSEVRLVERLRGLPREQALEAAIEERLMFVQASRLPQTAPSIGETEEAYAGLVEKLGGWAEDETALRELARRQATILKYVDFRFRPLVRAERAMRPEAAAGDESSTAAGELAERIEEWVAELREEAAIRYNPEPPGAS
jgi:hypothetical protein